MLLLAFDTATPRVTVALHDGDRVLGSFEEIDAHRHAELLAPAIAKVIADAGADRRDLTGVGVGVGPGPYTGLRVGLVTAKVLADALGIPGYGVCSLDVVAAAVAPPGGEFLVATDARRREVYWARYDGTGRRIAGPEVSRAAEIPDRDVPVAGEGAVLYPDALGGGHGAAGAADPASSADLAGAADPAGQMPKFPAAADLCRIIIDRSHPLLPLEPLYLRRPDAREPTAPKRVSKQ